MVLHSGLMLARGWRSGRIAAQASSWGQEVRLGANCDVIGLWACAYTDFQCGATDNPGKYNHRFLPLSWMLRESPFTVGIWCSACLGDETKVGSGLKKYLVGSFGPKNIQKCWEAPGVTFKILLKHLHKEPRWLFSLFHKLFECRAAHSSTIQVYTVPASSMATCWPQFRQPRASQTENLYQVSAGPAVEMNTVPSDMAHFALLCGCTPTLAAHFFQGQAWHTAY